MSATTSAATGGQERAVRDAHRDRRAGVDPADGAAAVIGRRDGSLPPSTAALVAVPAAAVGVGIWLLGSGLR